MVRVARELNDRTSLPTMTTPTALPSSPIVRGSRTRRGLAGLLLSLTLLGGCDALSTPERAAPRHRPADALLDDPALQAIAEAQNARDTTALVAALADVDPAVRARAAYGLGSLRAPVAVPALLPLLADEDPRVRADVAFALGQLDPAAVADSTSHAFAADLALLERLESETEPQVRATLVESVGKVAGAEAAETLIAARPDASEQAAWALALGRTVLRGEGGEAGWARLAEQVPSEDPEIRAAASWAFTRTSPIPGWFGHRRAIRATLAGLGFEDEYAWLHIQALARNGDRFSRELLEGWFEGAADWRARVAAASSVGFQRSTRSWELLLARLADPSVHVRTTVAQQLATEPWGPTAIDRVSAQLREAPEDWAPNEILLSHLASQGEEAPVREWWGDGRWTDARWATVAVRIAEATATRQGVEWLFEAARVESERIRRDAVAALRERWALSRPYPQAHEVFLTGFDALLRADDDEVAIAAVELLGDSVLVQLGAGERLRSALTDGAVAGARVERIRAVLAGIDGGTTSTEAENPADEEATSAGADETPGDGPVRPDLDWERLRALGPYPRLVLRTPEGEITLRLSTTEAPLTVQEITRIAEEGRYDGTPFHRVIANFVAQGGDVSRVEGHSGPGVRLRSELTRIPYAQGVLGMARTQRFDTEGSQFFITHSTTPHLTGLYGAFGWVERGMDVVERIAPGTPLIEARVLPDGG